MKHVRNSVCRITFLCAIILSLVTQLSAAEPQASGLTARHAAGQTLLAFREVDPPLTDESIAVKQLQQLRQQLDAKHKVRYRVYRSDKPIESLQACELVAEVPPLTCWNADYHGIYPKPDQLALRYVVEDGQAPVPPGTGIVAHNPAQAGHAYYAVTVVIDGQENTALDAANTLRTPVEETVGQGIPVLQRIERPERFNYVENPTLYYYVRWESPPCCAVHGKPYDYLVAVPPNVAKPAPVGIHLHCWGAI